MGYDIQVARTLEDIHAIREVWAALQPHPNADPDFYQMILRGRSEVMRPHVVALRQRGAVRALAVARLEETTIDLKIGYQTVFAPRVRALIVIYGGLIGDHSAATADTLVSELMRSLKDGEADLVQLDWLDTHCALYERARSTPSFVCRDHLVQTQTHSMLELSATHEQVMAQLSRDHRQQLKRKARNLEKRYPDQLDVRSFVTSEDIDQLCTDVEEVARKTYQRGLGVGFIDSPETRSRLALEAKRERLQVYVLYLAGRPVAYWWGTVYAGTFYSHALGYDPSFGEHSPGTYLTLKAIEALCQMSVRRIDFGIGDARYKQQFATRRWEEATVRIFAPRLRPILLCGATATQAAMTACARKALKHSEMLQSLKGRWRRRLASRQDA